MNTIFLHDFNSLDDVLREFNITADRLNGYEILLASYAIGCYEGWSFVLLKHTESGELFTVYASHCSCYGLEGQFDMESASVEQLKKLYAEDYYAYTDCKTELGEILDSLA